MVGCVSEDEILVVVDTCVRGALEELFWVS